MYLEDGVIQQIERLSVLARQVYGIQALEIISFRKHPEFVSCVIRDITNIAYNLSIADHISSESEKELLLLTFQKIFYPHGEVNAAFMESMKKQFDSYEHTNPSIKSPIYILEQAKHYDKQFNTQITPALRDCIIAFGDAIVMADGFESIGEFDVMETFRMWVEQVK